MNFYVYREITHDNPGKPTYQLIGTTKYLEDAENLLSRWHSGYIIDANGSMIQEKNLTKRD